MGISANYQVYPFQLYTYALSTAVTHKARTPVTSWLVKVLALMMEWGVMPGVIQILCPTVLEMSGIPLSLVFSSKWLYILFGEGLRGSSSYILAVGDRILLPGTKSILLSVGSQPE